tara:strand:- start:29 stop:514 length:486 start_codon:yes stop_codon:yes gene_type:complete
MPLPLTRNRNRSSSDPVASADINDIDDMIIGGRHGALIVPISCIAAYVSGSPAVVSGVWVATTGSDNLQVPVVFPVGTVITQMRGYVMQDAATVISWELREVQADGTNTLLESHAGNATSGNKILSTSMSVTIAEGRSYYLDFDFGKSGDSLYFFDASIYK